MAVLPQAPSVKTAESEWLLPAVVAVRWAPHLNQLTTDRNWAGSVQRTEKHTHILLREALKANGSC